MFPCRGLVAPCQRAPGSITGLPFRCQRGETGLSGLVRSAEWNECPSLPGHSGRHRFARMRPSQYSRGMLYVRGDPAGRRCAECAGGVLLTTAAMVLPPAYLFQATAERAVFIERRWGATFQLSCKNCQAVRLKKTGSPTTRWAAISRRRLAASVVYIAATRLHDSRTAGGSVTIEVRSHPIASSSGETQSARQLSSFALPPSSAPAPTLLRGTLDRASFSDPVHIRRPAWRRGYRPRKRLMERPSGVLRIAECERRTPERLKRDCPPRSPATGRR